jgi:hypothetical protein
MLATMMCKSTNFTHRVSGYSSVCVGSGDAKERFEREGRPRIVVVVGSREVETVGALSGDLGGDPGQRESLPQSLLAEKCL